MKEERGGPRLLCHHHGDSLAQSIIVVKAQDKWAIQCGDWIAQLAALLGRRIKCRIRYLENLLPENSAVVPRGLSVGPVCQST